jgi:cell wall-associated NlpC family hydrolase
MTEKPRRFVARITLVALITLTASVGFSNLSSAAPNAKDVQAAKDRLDALNIEMDRLVEDYNQAQLRLQEVQERLKAVQLDAQKAQSDADEAVSNLNANASHAYQGVGSQIAVLFDATSLSDFSDRLEFISNLAQADSDLANAAEVAKQQARWTAEELESAVAERQGILDDLASQRDQIDARVEEARQLYTELDREYHEALAAQQAAEEAAAAAAAQSTSTPSSPSPGGTSSIPAPPAPNGNVQAVLNAAYSVIGTPYQWGGASPESGFDCSGLTMWSWAHAGVYLPHSSAAQYSSLPHVDRTQLQPGDLLFFYSPISHVGMYVGGGQMIHAPHTGSVVSVVPVYWDSFVGAARPG